MVSFLSFILCILQEALKWSIQGLCFGKTINKMRFQKLIEFMYLSKQNYSKPRTYWLEKII